MCVYVCVCVCNWKCSLYGDKDETANDKCECKKLKQKAYKTILVNLLKTRREILSSGNYANG